VAQGSGLTRGDRNRNQRIAALRAVVRRDRAVLAIDLGEDKQAGALVDHEGRVLARRTVKAKAYQLGELLAWAAEKAAAAGSSGLTVACEPTGHRWKALMGLADTAGHGFVCVQSLAVARAREGDDYTRDKTDPLTRPYVIFYCEIEGAELGFCLLVGPAGDLRSWLRWLRCVDAERDGLAEQLEYAALSGGRDGEFLEVPPVEADGVSGETPQGLSCQIGLSGRGWR